MYPKWIIDMPVKGKTIVFSEYNIGKDLHDLGID